MKKLLILFLIITLTACASDNIKVHGNIISDDDITYIEKGETSKNDMVMMFGQPTTIASFDEKIWYYIGQKIKHKSFMKPEIIERKILEVHFNDEGVVDNINLYSLSDGEQIEYCKDETETLGTNKSALQELIGNIGKFNTPNSKTLQH